MLLRHIFTPKIAHSSYMLLGKASCAVVDPRRDVDVYVREATRLGVRITHVLETHLHADFVSGHIELAAATGATVYAPASANCDFDHVPLREGDVVELEDMRLEVVETPGHTPEHICYVVTDTSRGDSPVGLFSGDTLFVGDVGRPDLFPNRAGELARALFTSLNDKLLNLPDHCEIYPAHGAGSLCGRSVGAKYRTTLGYERRHNPALAIEDEDAFVRSLTIDMPPAPDHFGRCSEINRRGPTRLADLQPVLELGPAEFRSSLEEGGVPVDVRRYTGFAGLHVPGAWHVDLAANFPTFAGWVLPPDEDLLLVSDGADQAAEAALWVRRVGLDRVRGQLQGGVEGWAAAGGNTASVSLVSAETLYERVTGNRGLVLIDVRSHDEFADTHIAGAVNIPGPDLRACHRELDPEQPIYLVCSSGSRASLAASILKRVGFRDLYVVAGGMAGYSAAGHAKRCDVCENPHGSRYFARLASGGVSGGQA